MWAKANSEQQLAERLNRGEKAAMDEFYGLYADHIWTICLRYVCNQDDAKDVFQDTLLRVISNIGTFRYQGIGSLKAWVTRITVNRALSFLKESRRLATSDMEGNEQIADEPAPATDGLTAEFIADTIARLPDGYRTVFNMYVIEGMSHREIAQMLGIKEASSASQLNRAKAMLARMLKDYR